MLIGGLRQAGRMTTTLITGANKGLGYETARLIAAGHTVYIGRRDAERGRRAAEQLGARLVQLNVTDETSVAVAAKAIEAVTPTRRSAWKSPQDNSVAVLPPGPGGFGRSRARSARVGVGLRVSARCVKRHRSTH